MDRNEYPEGWNKKAVDELIEFYESLPDEKAIAEDEAAFNDSAATVMAIPHKLVPLVRMMLVVYRRTPLAGEQ